jgi:DNA-binding GntR family transcriptional regulator
MQIERLRVIGQKGYDWEASFKDHLEIISLIRLRDVEKCTDALSRHLRRVKLRFIETLGTFIQE